MIHDMEMNTIIQSKCLIKVNEEKQKVARVLFSNEGQSKLKVSSIMPRDKHPKQNKV